MTLPTRAGCCGVDRCAGGIALTTKGKATVALHVKQEPKCVRSSGQLAGNIAHHVNRCRGHRRDVTDFVGAGWYSGPSGIVYHWPEVLRSEPKTLVRRSGVFRFEARVAKSLQEHIKLHNMEELFGEVMVPTEEVVEIRGGQRRKSERKFFLVTYWSRW